jgi:hypothetical protein
MENYFWQNGNLGESKHHTIEFSEISLSTNSPEQPMFKVLKGAYIEP